MLAVAAAVVMGWVPSALAHGPCGSCLSRWSGPPGTEVTVTNTTAYWIVWNGRGLPQDGALRPRYRPRSPTIDLVRYELSPASTEGLDPGVVSVARRNVRFQVPEVDEGTYPVVIYDGSEGGVHYTWDLFRVTAAGEGTSSRWGVVLVAAALVCVGALYLARRVQEQRRQ